MRVVLTIVGALLGLAMTSGARELLGALLGGIAGYALAELASLRGRLEALEDELKVLRRSTTRAAQSQDPVQQRDTPATRAASAGSGTAAAEAPQRATRAQAAPSWPRGPQTTTATTGQPPSGAAPSEPQVVRLLREYFTGGNTLVRVGIIILFFGVAFLLRYVAEHSHVSIELRLSGVALGAVVLLVLGWRLRTRRSDYALALQGGAVGILYLTIFAALRLYSLLTPTAAFGLLALLAALSAALAVLQSSQAFALLAVTGGFLAPILAATEHGSHIVLFSYYAVVNASILGIAWFKAWRPLNVAGFLFTFVIGTVWGVLKYTPDLFASTEPFLALFFLFYVAMAVLFAIRQPPELRGYVDGTLVFGTPIAAFGLQSALLHGRPFTLAYSALVVSAFYLALARILRRRDSESRRLLIEAFMALGVVFLTLAVPLALDGRWSAATWAIEGAALVWIGCRQGRRLPRAFGAFLQIAGGIIFWRDIGSPYGNIPILNSVCLGGLMVSIASVLSAGSMQRYRERLLSYEQAFPAVLFFWGVLWWVSSGLWEIARRVPDPDGPAVALVFITVTALVCSELQRRSQLSFARLPALWLLPAMALFAGRAVVETHHPHPFADGGWLAWPCAFAGFYVVCRRHEGPAAARLANTLHTVSAWLLTGLASWEVAWAIDQGVAGSGSWPAIAWALVPGVVLFALPRLARRVSWPLALHREAYVVLAGCGFALYLALWSLVTNLLLKGDPYPLPYVPLINPLDLAQAFVLLVLLRFWLHLRAARYSMSANIGDRAAAIALAGLTFVWLSAALLRTLHHWAGVPFAIEAMVRSTLVQTALSIFWTVLALTTMLVATRRGARVVWLAGAGLLVVVIVKLFVVDLVRIGTIERIVSFVGVGLLMLVIGYFSPLPPAAVVSAKERE